MTQTADSSLLGPLVQVEKDEVNITTTTSTSTPSCVLLFESFSAFLYKLITYPNQLWIFSKKVSDTFGTNYTRILFIIYGLNQGLGEGWFYPAQNYYLKDIAHVGPVGAGAYAAVAHIPWTIKPIYGIISDGFPLFRLHRTYYIFIAAIIGTISATAPFSLR